jgi:hypothetical protein
VTALLFALIGIAVGSVLWSNARAASEAAIRHGHRACEQAGVQWLDQSVHLVRIRVRRGQDGRIGLERHFRFEYSRDGDDRHSGRIVLFGTGVVELIGPAGQAPVAY